jgi:RNA polymerase sigma-70 factor (ECF subfamily)
MLASADGGRAHHENLLRAVEPLLRSFFGRRLGADAPDLDDLVQESLIAVHTRRSSFDRARLFTPWLFSIARHKLMDHFRRTRRFESVDSLVEVLVSEGFERSSNAAMDIERLLKVLPAKQAFAIRETKIRGLSVVEAAEQRSLTASDIKVSVHRGMMALSRWAVPATAG